MFIIHEADPIVGVGGPQDSLMDHDDKNGTRKFRKKCTLPLTGKKVVDTIVTEMGYMRVKPEGLVLEEIAPGVTVEEVQAATQAKLIVSPKLKEMTA